MWKIAFSTTRLVSRHRGTLPVLLTCPHGGEEELVGIPKRNGVEECDFNPDRDLQTRTITTRVAQRLLDVFGEAPYVVIAEFDRDYIDANRSAETPPPNCAFEHPAAGEFYNEYHDTIREFINEIRANNGELGLLFDIHGTKGVETDPADLYLGTDDGKTVERLLKADRQAMSRPRSLRGFLTAAGHNVSSKQPETFRGGYTVRTYGSSNAGGLDAIQLEIGPDLRDEDGKPEAFNAFIEHLSYAIGNLVPRWAETNALAAFHTIRLGGESENRGRLEIRQDPGTGNGAARRAGVLVLDGENGSDFYLWADNQGKLRISPSDPGTNSQAGTIVGTQT
jgi:N-formylglutamate amidohydrolase